MIWLRAIFRPDSSGLHGPALTDYLAKRHTITVWWFCLCILAAAVLFARPL